LAFKHFAGAILGGKDYTPGTKLLGLFFGPFSNGGYTGVLFNTGVSKRALLNGVNKRAPFPLLGRSPP